MTELGEDVGGGSDGPEILDLRGLKCPLPALRTRRKLALVARGHTIEVISTDPLAALDIPHLLAETGDEVIGLRRDGIETRISIRKS